VSEERFTLLSNALTAYISTYLPDAIEKRESFEDYRTSPYVLLTTASVRRMTDPHIFGEFLFNTKLYAGLETSFGKSIEKAFVDPYPLGSPSSARWTDPIEKREEEQRLRGLRREEKAQVRQASRWREIDKSCVVGGRRYLLSIKSGPNCINDTQATAMASAIASHYRAWMEDTRRTYPDVAELDVVLGITYGTDRTTNNKENQVLAKLFDSGFIEEDRRSRPGVLVDRATRRVRVYRMIGQDFWAFVGQPDAPERAAFVFLEILLALSKALQVSRTAQSLEDRVNNKINDLADAIRSLSFPRNSLPPWVRQDFDEDELLWLATALTHFFDPSGSASTVMDATTFPTIER
jgi:hypothetical protein